MGIGAKTNVYELVSHEFNDRTPGTHEVLWEYSKERSRLGERMQDERYLWALEDVLTEESEALANVLAEGTSRRVGTLQAAKQRYDESMGTVSELRGIPDKSVLRLHGYMTNHLLKYVADGKDPNFINLFAQMTQSVGERRGEAVRQQKMLQYAALHTPIAKRRNLAHDQTAQYQLAVLEQGIQNCGYVPQVTLHDARIKKIIEDNKRTVAAAATLGAIGLTTVANASVAAAAPSSSVISSEAMIASSVPLQPGVEIVGSAAAMAPGKVSVGKTQIESAAPLAAGIEFASTSAAGGLTKVSVGATAMQSEGLAASIDFAEVTDGTAKTEVTVDTSTKSDQPMPASIDFNAPADNGKAKTEVTIDTTAPIEATEDAAAQPSIDVSKAPDDAIEAKPTETPQEAIGRVATESKDYDRARAAVVLIYGDQAAPKSTNKGLEGAAISAGVALNEQVRKGAHADAGEEKIANMIKLAAYFDAAVSDQSILSNPEVQQAIAELTKVPEGYEGRLIQAYIEEAKKALEADEGKLFAGVSENHREQLQTMYGFVLLSGVPHAEQAAKMQAMKEEDERKAAEEAARKAAEAAAAGQGSTEVEAIAGDQNKLLQAAIERAAQQNGWQPGKTILMQVITQEGAPLAAAAGIMGNAAAESGFDPGIVERGNGIGFGYFQWSFGRRTALEQAAANQGVSAADPTFQARYMVNESKNRTQRGDSSKNEWAGLVAIQDPAAAADFFRWHFERPNEHLAHGDHRVKVAQEVYAQVEGQMQAIQQEAAAAQQAREAEAARKAAEEAERQNGMSSGRAISGSLAERYGGVSGKIDESELTTIALPYHSGGTVHAKFQKEAGEQFAKLNEAYKARWGTDMIITDHYRPYDVQVSLKARYNAQGKGHLAATPGKSNHGWGMAVDMGNAVGGGFRTEQYQWMMENAPQYGWINPSWAREGSKKAEYWHWEYLGSDANKEGVKQFLG